VVDFEDRRAVDLLPEAIGARVVPGAEDDDLFDLSRERAAEAIVDGAMAAKDERDEARREALGEVSEPPTHLPGAERSSG
jgi:hypothetical protein